MKKKTAINRASILLLGLMGSLLGMASVVQGAPTQAISYAQNNSGGAAATFSVGWDFTTTVPITITSLGKFDIGTTDDSDVAIYARGGAMLATTTVLATDPTQAIGSLNARYRSIAPVVLPAGNYVVFGQTRNSSFIEGSLSTTFSPQIKWNEGVASGVGSAFDPLPASAPASWPITNPNPSRYFGPTFEYTLQTPSGTPLALTGWSQDVIAESTAASPAAGTTVNYAGNTGVDWVWYEQGAPNSTQGLPSSGSFTSAYNPNVTFQFQSYTANNAVLENGSLALVNPGKYESLSFLVSAQGGNGQSFSVTLHFSDNTTTVLSANDPDWTFSGGNEALGAMGLVPRDSTWTGFYAGNLHMFEHDFTLSLTDQTKTLVSLDFAKTSGNHEALFAVSAHAVPEPGACLLLSLGAVGLMAARRRRETSSNL